MTDLYRGLLQILVMRCVEQIESLRVHIRAQNSGVSQMADFDIGVTGFWNLLLESTFTIFTIMFMLIGICLTTMLAVFSYPFAAFLNYGSWLLRNTKNPSGDSPTIIKSKNVEEKI